MTRYRAELMNVVGRGRIAWITSDHPGFEREFETDAAAAQWLTTNLEPGDTVTFVRGERMSEIRTTRTAVELLADAELGQSMWKF
jgi:hypothetical protein